MPSQIEFKLFFKLLKNEASYFVNMLILLSSLFFILFVLFASKEIFSYYSDENSILLPQHMLYIHKPLAEVKEQLAQAKVPTKQLLFASMKNYDKLCVFCNINGEKSLPKKYTLLAFEMKKAPKLHLSCQGKTIDVPLKNISLRYRKNWIFTTKTVLKCALKSSITLLTAEGNFPLELKRNTTKAQLLYRSTKKSDTAFYHYLINLEESLFIHYFPYSKFFKNTKSSLSKETQTHAKMLNSLFKLIFAGHKERIILNHLSYHFLTDYKKIPFRVNILNKDFTTEQTVLDETALQLSSKKTDINNYLIIANRSSYPHIKYDTTLIFSKNTIANSLFPNAISLSRKDFTSVQKSASFKIALTSYLVAFTLFILLLALLHSFISRLYKRYAGMFHTLIFYGFKLKVLTLFLTLFLGVSILIASFMQMLLFQKVNAIFGLYYVDLITINIQTNSLFLLALFGIVFAYRYESKVQKNLILNTKG